MLLTNSWVTTLLIIEKGTGVNANIRAEIYSSSSNWSGYGVFMDRCKRENMSFF